MWDKGLYEVIILKFILDKYVFRMGDKFDFQG